ncbi:MAG: acyl-CoA dehydrogenase family protein, partial [Pseudonocardiaceae bacterium]
VIPRDAEGIQVGRPESKLGLRAADTATVSFTATPVPACHRIGAENAGFALAMTSLERSRPGVAALAVGIARAAFEMARDYAGQRVQFGVPIAMHQGIQFMIADMATKIEAARLLAWKSADLLERGMPGQLASAHAKRFAADAAMEVALDAVQVYGGHGISTECRVEKLMRDAKIMQIYEGTSQIQRLIIAREILQPGITSRSANS